MFGELHVPTIVMSYCTCFDSRQKIVQFYLMPMGHDQEVSSINYGKYLDKKSNLAKIWILGFAL